MRAFQAPRSEGFPPCQWPQTRRDCCSQWRPRGPTAGRKKNIVASRRRKPRRMKSCGLGFPVTEVVMMPISRRKSGQSGGRRTTKGNLEEGRFSAVTHARSIALSWTGGLNVRFLPLADVTVVRCARRYTLLYDALPSAECAFVSPVSSSLRADRTKRRMDG